jgi:hypothetical protein
MKKRKPPKLRARATDVHATDSTLRQQRERLIELFFDEAVTSHDRSVANGLVDCVVIVIDIHDAFGPRSDAGVSDGQPLPTGSSLNGVTHRQLQTRYFVFHLIVPRCLQTFDAATGAEQ